MHTRSYTCFDLEMIYIIGLWGKLDQFEKIKNGENQFGVHGLFLDPGK